jgi:hypothetical protein
MARPGQLFPFAPVLSAALLVSLISTVRAAEPGERHFVGRVSLLNLQQGQIIVTEAGALGHWRVDPGLLVHEEDLIYPLPHLQGALDVEGQVTTDGRIVQIRVVSRKPGTGGDDAPIEAKPVNGRVDILVDGHPIADLKETVACPTPLRFVPFVRTNGPTSIRYRVDYQDDSSKYGPGQPQTGQLLSYQFTSDGEVELKGLSFRLGSAGEKRSGWVKLFVNGVEMASVPYAIQCRP